MSCLIGLIVLCLTFSLAADVTLVRDGVPVSVIVLEKHATKSAQLGAAELRHHVKRITGAELPVVTEADPSKVNLFIGGHNQGMKQESSRMLFKGGDIYLTGNDTADFGKVDYRDPKTFPPYQYFYNGSLWAVYDFLERCCGVRFYGMTEDSTTFTPRGTLTVKEENREYSPRMDAFRDVYYWNPKTPARDVALWRLRWRMTSFFGQTNHNMYSLYFHHYKRAKSPHLADVFRGSKPEYFAQGYQGRGGGDPRLLANYPGDKDLPPQLCYTNPGVSDWYADEILTYYRGGNRKGGLGNKDGTLSSTDITILPRMEGKPFYYPIEGGDNGGFCLCPECRKLLPDKNNASNLKFTLMSEIARKTAKLAPSAGVSTLAYLQTMYYPEAVSLPENLSVQLCLTVYSWWHPTAYRLQHGEYKKWIRSEAKKRPLTLWTYLFSSYWDAKIHFGQYQPFPAFYPWKTGELFKEFTADGIRGWFTEVQLEYNMLEAYVAARICYDPLEDPETLIADYFRNSYGAAGRVMEAFYREVENAFWNPENCPEEWRRNPEVLVGPFGKKHPFWGTGLISPDLNWKLGTEERMAKLGALIAEAQKKVATPQEKRRLKQFVDTVWETAVRGKAEYEQRKGGAKHGKAAVIRTVASAGGDPDKISWSRLESIGMTDPLGLSDTPDSFSLAADSSYLYFRFETKKDHGGRARFRICFSDPEGKTVRSAGAAQKDAGEPSVSAGEKDRVKQLETDGSWVVSGALPLASLPFRGGGISANVIRLAPRPEEDAADVALWQPTYYSREYTSPRYFGTLCVTPYVVQDDAFSYEGGAKRISDPAASDRSAGSMNAAEGWTMKYFVNPALYGTKEISLKIRTDVRDPKGMFVIGVYDKFNRRVLFSRPVHAASFQGKEYRKFTLGSVNLIPGCYLYLTSLVPKSGTEQHYYVDQIIFE